MHSNQKIIFTLIFLYFSESKSEKTYYTEEKKYLPFNTTYYYYYDSLIFSMINRNLNRKYDIISLELKNDLI